MPSTHSSVLGECHTGEGMTYSSTNAPAKGSHVSVLSTPISSSRSTIVRTLDAIKKDESIGKRVPIPV